MIIAKTIAAGDVASQVTLAVEITGRRRFEMRLKAAALIFRFGAWVLGSKGRVSVELE